MGEEGLQEWVNSPQPFQSQLPVLQPTRFADDAIDAPTANRRLLRYMRPYLLNDRNFNRGP